MSETNAELVKALDNAGRLPTKRIRSAFHQIDRADFIPERMWFGGDPDNRERDTAADRNADPDEWARAVYDPYMPIVTQWDDGEAAWPEVGARPTSSCSAPSVVASMLAALDPEPGDNVFEIGTGTGYNAALLAEVVGPGGDVTTVEVDARTAMDARENLIHTGHERHYGKGMGNVGILRQDGTATTVSARPWDRIISTAAVPVGRVPYTWIEQARPGTVLIMPITTDLTDGPLLRLEVGKDFVARGNPVPDTSVSFMRLQAERGNAAQLDTIPWDKGTPRRTDTDLIAPFDNREWLLAIGLGMPRCRYDAWEPGQKSEHQLLILQDPTTRAWASIHGPNDAGGFEVRQDGPRQLADELAAVLRWFASHCDDNGDPPPWSAWQWRVSRERQTVSLPPDWNRRRL